MFDMMGLIYSCKSEAILSHIPWHWSLKELIVILAAQTHEYSNLSNYIYILTQFDTADQQVNFFTNKMINWIILNICPLMHNWCFFLF